jgi:hypothetical protein
MIPVKVILKYFIQKKYYHKEKFFTCKSSAHQKFNSKKNVMQLNEEYKTSLKI